MSFLAVDREVLERADDVVQILQLSKQREEEERIVMNMENIAKVERSFDDMKCIPKVVKRVKLEIKTRRYESQEKGETKGRNQQ